MGRFERSNHDLDKFSSKTIRFNLKSDDDYSKSGLGPVFDRSEGPDFDRNEGPDFDLSEGPDLERSDGPDFELRESSDFALSPDSWAFCSDILEGFKVSIYYISEKYEPNQK